MEELNGQKPHIIISSLHRSSLKNSYHQMLCKMDSADDRTGQRKISNLMPMLLPRSKMDPNRNEEEGAQGRELAQCAYREFHGRIAQV